MLDSEQLQELERLAKAATPWTKDCWCPEAAGEGLCIKHPIKHEALIRVSWHNGYNDVNFVLAANPEMVLSLIAEVRRLESKIVEMWRVTSWLADKLADTGYCKQKHPDCDISPTNAKDCKMCWIKTAQNAVQSNE